MNLEDMMQMWDTDSIIDNNYLGDHSTATPKLHAKYIRLLINTKLKHTKIQSDYLILRKSKFRLYRGELSRDELSQLGWDQWQGLKPLKAELDTYLDGDSDIVAVKLRITYLETMIYFIESVLGQIKTRDWQIKNGIEFKKFLAGM